MGNQQYYDSAKANAVPSDLKEGETAFVKGALITGTASVYVVDSTLYVPEGWIQVHVVGS